MIEFDKVPFLPGVPELATAGVIPGGTRDNYNYTFPHVAYPENISQTKRLMLNDAQTSGGLLIALAPDKARKLIEKLREEEIGAVAIGRVEADSDKKIKIT